MTPALIHLLQTAIQEIQANKLDSAKSRLKEVLSVEERHPEALRILGVIAALQQEWAEALRSIDLVLEIDPENAIAYSNRGNILNALKRHDEALGCYEKAIRYQPNYAESYSNQGNVLQTLGRYKDAIASYGKATELEPAYSEAFSNMGNALQALGRYDDALASYEKAIKIEVNSAQAFYGAASIFNFRKQFDYALGCCNQVLKINPQAISAELLKGQIFFQVKDYENAIASYDAALLIDPHSADAWISKGNVFLELKQFDQSKIAFNKVLELAPNSDFINGLVFQGALQMCDWQNQAETLTSLVEKVKLHQKATIPYNLISLLDDKILIKRSIEIYAEAVRGGILRVSQGIISPKKRIRLGYFSADFHNHPTAHLIAQLFECHDKNQFELIAFVFGRNVPDEMRERLQKAFDQFIDVNDKTDEEIAQLSRDMEVDIAIDLKGFTQEGRPRIFMYGAAPIQIGYLGFPGTMGLSCFDYIVADHTLIPDAAQDGMAEKIIYMPNSYQVNDRHRAIATVKMSREELGLPPKGFIFCCFNNNYKITPAVFDGWVRILKAVEGSVLWLYADNPFAVENLKKEAQSRGLDIDRLIFAGRMNSADHLARYQFADLFLDTTPCNAHTTASDALWVGLPVLTLLGESFGARVAASLLNAVGLPELVADTQEEYGAIAIKLAKNPDQLNTLKMRLKENLLNAPLFDTPLFTKHLELSLIHI